MAVQAGFSEIDVALDATEDFIADHALVAEVDDGPAFLVERRVGQAFVFDAEALQRVGFCRIAFGGFIEAR